ncbi:hypothetical protein ACP70R_019755 [Stipagrostis hirtigluma subsp. patula]
MAMEIETVERKEEAALRWKAPLAMVLVQLSLTGMLLLAKLVMSEGMFIFTLLAYRSFIGAVFILPLALIFERGKWKEMDWHAFSWIFFNAFIGTNLLVFGANELIPPWPQGYNAIVCRHLFQYSSSDHLHSVPHTQMETLQFWAMAGSLKVAGVFIAVGGTMLISFYKGKTLHLWNSILHHHKNERKEVATHQLRGSIFFIGSSITFACWYLIQSKVHKVYPYKYWSSMATCLAGGFQTAFFGIILRRDWNTWKLGWDLQLVTVVYTGVFATAGKYALNSWVVARRGPAYTAMFLPLAVVFTVLLSIIIGDDITVGSLLGTTTVIAGLYIFLWAKSKELPAK